MKISIYLIIIFLLVTAVSGCSIGPNVEKNFVGTEWHLLLLNGHDLIPTSHKKITMKISDKGIRGYGGCNQFSNDGNFSMRSGKISIKSVVSNAKSCGAEIDKQETEFYRALMAAKTYQVRGGRLELYDTGGKRVLVFEKTDTE